MRFDFIRRTEGDIDAAAIGLPTRNTRRVMLVGVSDAAVVLFLVFVLFGVRRGIAPQPELFDELLAFLVRVELLKRLALFVGDDVHHVFVEPFLPGSFQLLAEFLFLFAALFFGEWFGDRFA